MPESLLSGLLGLDADLRAPVLRFLEDTWQVTTGSFPTGLSHDLGVCRRWFDPVAQGQRLRAELLDLPPWPPGPNPGPPFTLAAGDSSGLVTPEGRCAMDVLAKWIADPSRAGEPGELIEYDQRLAALYREWSRHRLQGVVDLLAGSTKPLQIPAAGLVVTLMVNRCTSRERAWVRFASLDKRSVVDEAFSAPMQEFCRALGSAKKGSAPTLRKPWMLHEAHRRLAGSLVSIDTRGKTDGFVWIEPKGRDHVISTVVRDLARGHRVRIGVSEFEDAFDGLVDALRRVAPQLAAFGLAHERPPETARLRSRLVAEFREQADVGE